MKLNKILILILGLLISPPVLFAEQSQFPGQAPTPFGFNNGNGFGNPGMMGGGGGGNSGGGNSGGGAQPKPNPLVQEIAKKGEESAKELTKTGENGTKNVKELDKDFQKGIETELNRPDKSQEIIKGLVERQKSQDEAREKSNESSEKALAENKKSMNTLVDTIVDLNLKTLQASLPPRREVDSIVKTPSNAELLSQVSTQGRGPSSFGSALSARDLASEERANNTTPPSGSTSSSEGGHSGHNHGVKSSKIHNPPAEGNF